MKWEDSLEAIYNELGSDRPAPGGGSAAALGGILACGLLDMLEKLNPPPEGEAAVNPVEIKNGAKKFMELAEKDARSYLDIVKAFKMPKNTDDEKAARKEAIREATIHATRVPMETAEHGLEMLEKSLDLASRLKKSMASDLCVSLLLLTSVFEGAMMNVYINLPGIKNHEIQKELRDKAESLETDWKKKISGIHEIMAERGMI